MYNQANVQYAAQNIAEVLSVGKILQGGAGRYAGNVSAVYVSRRINKGLS